MRLPYTDNPPKFDNEDDKAILGRVQARRGERGLIPLDTALLHAPKIADGWNALLGAVRTRSSLPDAIREIAICRPALINSAWFEWNAHYPLLLSSDGFTEKKGEVVKQLHPASQGDLTDAEWAVLQYADAMTRSVSVPEGVFEGMKKALEKEGMKEQQVVEVTVTVASYNMVSRFLVALDVGEQNAKAPEWATKVTNAGGSDGKIQS